MRVRMILFCLVFAVVLTGCQTQKKSDLSRKPTFVLTCYRQVEYPTGSADEDLLEKPDGSKKFWVYRKPRFHSREIVAISPIPLERQPGYYDLKLKLSERGGRWWDTMIDYCYEERIAVALDGFLLTDFKAQFIAEDSYEEDTIDNTSTEAPQTVIIRGPFREELVEQICAHAPINHQYYKNVVEEQKKAAEEAASLDPYEEALKEERLERERRRKELNPNADFDPLKLW